MKTQACDIVITREIVLKALDAGRCKYFSICCVVTPSPIRISAKPPPPTGVWAGCLVSNNHFEHAIQWVDVDLQKENHSL